MEKWVLVVVLLGIFGGIRGRRLLLGLVSFIPHTPLSHLAVDFAEVYDADCWVVC